MVNPMVNKKQTIPTDLITWVSCTDCEIPALLVVHGWWLVARRSHRAKVSSRNLTPRRSRESVLVGPANQISSPKGLGW